MKKRIPSEIKKGYILGRLMILPLFTLICCKQKESGQNQNMITHIEPVESVKVVSAGGELGFSSSTLIDKDSIHYSRTVAANEADNLAYSRKLKPEDWKNLLDTINMKEFGAAKENPSVQPVDGIDTRIIVKTNAGEISKMNAYDDPAWKSIRDIIDQYSGSYR
ncbi:hypothetical protein [Chryseobacterium sp.]|uniref:hypothetical protein n=1 Tax=Chryseobacterium sp. TaxID=1871047 RepID=UPI00321A2D4B